MIRIQNHKTLFSVSHKEFLFQKLFYQNLKEVVFSPLFHELTMQDLELILQEKSQNFTTPIKKKL